jgi:flagellar basal-body rod modification protein FlgD
MEITSSLGTTLTATQNANATSNITSDFDTFLRMLTTQMQNQDPLNPVDSSDYAVQLATFSSVEQQTKTNQLLSTLNDQFDMLGMAQLASWVGKEARSDMPVYFSGAEVTLSPNPATTADRAVLVVQDATGNVVSRDDIPVSTAPFQWQGKDVTGATLPTGTYTLSLESYQDEALINSGPIESYGRILEVQGGADGNRILLAGGVVVPAAQISALRSLE